MKSREEDGRATDRTRIAAQFLKTTRLTHKRTIARELCKLYPDIFLELEPTRHLIRQLTNQDGEARRESPAQLERFTIEPESKIDLSWQKPFVIQGADELAVLGDFHGPTMDVDVVDEAIEAVRGVKTLLINGDLLDNHWLSRWRKDRDALMPSEEFIFIRELLEKLAKRFAKIYFKNGNHDNWLSRYVSLNASALDGVKDLKLENILGLSELGVTSIHDLQEVKFGDLSIMHGHEKPGFFTPINLAECILKWWQGYERRWDVKILVNHFHRVDETVKTGIDESIGRAWVNGCLCNTMPVYSPYGRHNHGIAIATKSKGIADVKLIRL